MKNMSKKITLIATLLLVAMLGSILCGCNRPLIDPDQNNTTAGLSYVTLRINPEIELVVDEAGQVVGTNAINEDGEVVLSQQDFVNMSVDAAAAAFTNVAVELGYIDINTEDATVYTDIQGANSELCAQFEAKMKDAINNYFNNNGIYGKVSPETLDKYAEEATEWGVSKGQAKMILRVLDLCPEMTAEELLELEPAELMDMIREAGQESERVSPCKKDDFKAAVAALKEEYASTFALKEEIEEIEDRLEEAEEAAETDDDDDDDDDDDETEYAPLTEEEKAQLEADLAAKKEQFKTEYAAFKEALKALKDEYKAATKAEHEDRKNEAEQKREECAGKIEEHKHQFHGDKDNIMNDIKNWREDWEQKHPECDRDDDDDDDDDDEDIDDDDDEDKKPGHHGQQKPAESRPQGGQHGQHGPRPEKPEGGDADVTEPEVPAEPTEPEVQETVAETPEVEAPAEA